MSKTTSSFNLPKSVKRMASSIQDPVQRGIYLRAMVDAESSRIAQKGRKWSDPAATQKSREVPKG